MMKQSEYRSRKELIEFEMRELENELAELKEEYIKANREFEDGEKIRIVTKEHTYSMTSPGGRIAGIKQRSERFAFVGGYEVSYDDKVAPVLRRCKKDGTISKVSDYASNSLVSLHKIK